MGRSRVPAPGLLAGFLGIVVVLIAALFVGIANLRNVGLGLGLAIVKSLVELHGGTVQAHSEGVGKGSTFVIQLPVAEPTGVFKSDPENRLATSATTAF